MVILPADTKSIKNIMTRDDIFPSLLVFSVLVSQNFLERRVLAPSKLSRLCSSPI